MAHWIVAWIGSRPAPDRSPALMTLLAEVAVDGTCVTWLGWEADPEANPAANVPEHALRASDETPCDLLWRDGRWQAGHDPDAAWPWPE